MEIYPAVDLYEGNVVRLERGRYESRKIYSRDPAQVARKWVEAGSRWLHVVDLEGARSGEIKNWQALEKILQITAVSVQFGGGVRRSEDIEKLLRLGVKRVILGTKVLDRAFLAETVHAAPERVALSIDLWGEEARVEGWLKGSGKSIFELFEELRGLPISCLIVTDIEKDGTLTGINLPKMRRVLEKSPFPILCSGGIASLEDLQSLLLLKKDPLGERLEGVIVGKALYEGRLDLREALRIVREGGNV